MGLLKQASRVAIWTTVCLPDLPQNKAIFDCCRKAGLECIGVPSRCLGSPSLRFKTCLGIFHKNRPSLIHFSLLNSSSCVEAICAGILLRKTFVITENRADENPAGGYKYLLYRRLVGWGAKRLIVPSQDSKNRLVSILMAPPSKVTVIPYGIDSHFFELVPAARMEYRRRLGIPQDETVFVQVANLEPYKRPDLLLEAFYRLPPHIRQRSRLLFVGEGQMKDQLLARTKELHLMGRVQCLGFRSDIREILQMSDVFLLASTYESFGIAILEAMACGLAVVTTAQGGPSEIVRNGETGFLVSEGDTEGFIQRLTQLADSEQMRHRFGEAGRRVSAEFRLSGMAEKTHAVYREVWPERFKGK